MCLPQKPWFYDIWQTWVGYPFQVSFLASRHCRYFPIGRGNPSSLFPPHGHHLKRCGTKASCLFWGSAAHCCMTSLDLPVLQLPPPARSLLFPPTLGHQLFTGDVISVPRFSAEPLHCSRPCGASRHSY